MRKVFMLGMVSIICLSMTSCAYRSINGVRIQGKDVDARYSQLTQTFSFKGKEVQATILRQSTLADAKTAQKATQIYNLADIKEGSLSFELNQK